MAEKPRACRARVSAVRSLAPDILEADLAMTDPPALPFEPGQWLSVPFGPKIVRAYSIASTPDRPSLITLCADVAPGGIGSQWFKRLAPGSDVEFKGPLGGFVFARAETRRPFFVAEEIGIVPIRSIVADLAARGDDRPIVLVQWAREASGLAYRDEFAALARRRTSFDYRPLVGTPLVDAIEREAPAIDNLVAYVAGGEQTIHAVRNLLTSRGLERKAVKWEKFW